MTPGSDAGDGRGWRVRLLVPAALFLIGLLGRTWRFRVLNAQGWERLRAERRPFIFALWHGQLLPISYRHGTEGIAVLISEHRDGEIIARVLHAWGSRAIRGSTTRGGGRALIAMTRELAAGREVAVTPDGPRGPARKFQAGALIAAQRAGVPIVPILASVDRAWRLRSWDQFAIPKPFARITIAYGDPQEVTSATPREAAAQAGRLEEAMQATQRLADA